MQHRARRIFAAIEGDVDVLVFTNAVEPHLDLSFFYVTDLVAGGLFERSLALAFPDGRVEVVTTGLEEPSARRAPEAAVTIFRTAHERQDLLKDRLKGARRIGINGTEATYADIMALKGMFPGAEFVDVNQAVQRARVVKDDVELARMQRAADVVTTIAGEIPDLLTEGMTESALMARINNRMLELGASGPSFATIVGFGPNSAEPHYATGQRKLQPGDFVLCDFGAYVEHYASDITRTWVFGTDTDKHRDIYDTVLRAQEAALAAIKPGAPGREVHEAAAAVIDASPYKGLFTHRVGHTLGLGVHDGGVLNSRSDLVLEPGVVITVEPGIYDPDFGGVRIEDDVVVTEDGYASLTGGDKSYRVVAG